MNQQIPQNVYLAPVNLQAAPSNTVNSRRRRRKNREKKKKEKEKKTPIWRRWEVFTLLTIFSLPIMFTAAWVQTKIMVYAIHLGRILLTDINNSITGLVQ